MVLDLLEFQREQILIPISPSYRTVHYQAESLDLRRLQPEMSVHDLAIASSQGDFEPKLADRAAHAIDDRVVLSRVAWIFDEPLDRPPFDILRQGAQARLDSCTIIRAVVSPVKRHKTEAYRLLKNNHER
jgi:hypothetical protein